MTTTRPTGSNTQQVTLQLQIATTQGDPTHTILMDTMYKYSHLCNMVSKIAFDTYCTGRSNFPYKITSFDLHNLPVYHEPTGTALSLYYYLREYTRQNYPEGIKLGGFPSAIMVQVFNQVAGSYNALFTRYRNTKSIKKRDKLLTRPVVFSDTTPIQYNNKTLNFKVFDPRAINNIGYGTISTSTGRTPFNFIYGDSVRDHLVWYNTDTLESIMPWDLQKYKADYWEKYKQDPNLLKRKICGAKLIYRPTSTRRKKKRYTKAKYGRVVTGTPGEGKFFLHVTLEKDTPSPTYNTTELPLTIDNYLGVDLGITNIATTSNGTNYSGSKIDKTRERHAKRKSGLQKRAKQVKSKRRNNIYKKIRKLGAKEYRFHTDINHCISKLIVEETERSGSNVIILENLSGIVESLKARRKQRSRMYGWSFSQLQEFIKYKAKLAGIRVILIDPRHTSQKCSSCGHIERSNRGSGKKREVFKCKQCAYTTHSDYNAAINIRDIGFQTRS